MGQLKDDVFEIANGLNCFEKLCILRDHPKKSDQIEKELDILMKEFFTDHENDTDFAENERNHFEESK